MTASTADYYGILGVPSDATLTDVQKAYRKLARQHHPDRNNAHPGAIDRFRRITEAYEYLSAHLKDNANGNGHNRPGPTAPPRADVGVPGGHSEAASGVLTMLEETWQRLVRLRMASRLRTFRWPVSGHWTRRSRPWLGWALRRVGTAWSSGYGPASGSGLRWSGGPALHRSNVRRRAPMRTLLTIWRLRGHGEKQSCEPCSQSRALAQNLRRCLD